MRADIFQYIVLVLFILQAGCFLYVGKWLEAVYWLGATLCTIAIIFK